VRRWDFRADAGPWGLCRERGHCPGADKGIRCAGCVAMAMCMLFLSACAGLPNKADVPLGNERFVCSRQGTGSPAVIFEAGLGGDMDSWAPVYKEVAALTTVFAYDRRGYGDSGTSIRTPRVPGGELVRTAAETALDVVAPGASTVLTLGTLASRSVDDDAPRTGAAIVAELHELLVRAGIQPPYILVGHSLGGLYISLYARTYPTEVAGVLLVDSMHPEQIERCRRHLPPEDCDPKYYPWWVKMLIKMTPAVIKAEMAGATETGRQIRAAGPLPPVPLTVLSHGKPPANEPGMGRMWAELQQDLAQESPRGSLVIAHGSGHNIQGDESELVIAEIKKLVMQACSAGTL